MISIPPAVVSEPEWISEAVPLEAASALCRLLRLGIPAEALAALASALEHQGEERSAGRASLHVDSPRGGEPAGVVVLGADGRVWSYFLPRRQ